jgi:hypothetical protein
MDVVRKSDLKSLSKERRGPCVSIYMRAFRKGEEVMQNPVRFKNLLAEAEDMLAEEGLRKPEAAELLSPALALETDSDFWQYQSDGLAVFASPGFFRFFRVQVPFEDLTVVTDRFHVKPLVGLLSGSERFYVLALSQNRVRLLHGSAQEVIECHLEEVPTSLAEALRYDDPEKQLQFHTGTPGHGGKRPAVSRTGRGYR